MKADILAGFILGVLVMIGVAMGMRDRELVERGYKQYNLRTGVLEWVEPKELE